MAKKLKVTSETKAAVLAALLEGQAASKVAADYKLPEGTVRSWRSRMQRDASPLTDVATEKRDEIGGLLMEMLRENLVTLRTQAVFARTESWLNLQSAADVAVLYGVITDKTVRLLEALAGSVVRDPQLPAP